MKDPVLIKSNKYGITIYFDPDMPYEELLPEVREKFESSAHFFNHADMAVEFEGRTFTEEEEQRMAEVIQEDVYKRQGYDSDVIMAAGAFVQGSSIELSADGPIKPPYAVYFQGGLTWPHAKLGILMSLEYLVRDGIITLP